MRSFSMAAAIGVFAILGGGVVHAESACPREGTLGVSRTVEIDTTGGPGFGMQHYKAYDFLQPKEVVLTFDDGPQKFTTEAVLKALADECTKATFFSIGKMALGYPEILREVIKAGHTVGTHTWSHQSVGKAKNLDAFKDEIERGISAVHRAAGADIAPFFRFPTLKDSPESLKHLASRNIAMFSTDIDSFDFKMQTSQSLAKSVVDKLEKAGKGIVLMHDIHKRTAEALPAILQGLREKGFKIVHMKAKGKVETLAEYDAAIEKDAKGLPQVGSERPTSSVVRTIEGAPTAEEAAPPAETAPAPVSPPPAAAPAAPQKGAEAVTEPSPPVQAAAPAPETSAVAANASEPKPASSPVKTVPETTSSVGETDSASGQSKPIVERAKEVWDTWFGKPKP